MRTLVWGLWSLRGTGLGSEINLFGFGHFINHCSKAYRSCLYDLACVFMCGELLLHLSLFFSFCRFVFWSFWTTEVLAVSNVNCGLFFLSVLTCVSCTEISCWWLYRFRRCYWKKVLFSWSPWIAEVSPITFNDLVLDLSPTLIIRLACIMRFKGEMYKYFLQKWNILVCRFTLRSWLFWTCHQP